MYSKIISGTVLGVSAMIVNVETDISSGLPSFIMVGCPGSEVKESKDRVWAALRNAGLQIPVAKITVNLSPADLHKDGTSYDLPISIGLLTSAGILPENASSNILFLGELGLNGEIKPVKGVLPIVREAAAQGFSECIVPIDNAYEGSVVPDIIVRGAQNIIQVIDYLKEKRDEIMPRVKTDVYSLFADTDSNITDDFSDINGQEAAKRAAVISAAGFHSLLMTGPPGTGKSMIAKRLPGILPPLTLDESLEVTSIYSIAGKLEKKQALVLHRSLQSPHHSITLPAMVGGGGIPKPGAISLAHRSVLFLDEFTEFDRHIIDSLRQPIEDKVVHISRARYSLSYPSDFLLICAMNPCPCGYYPDRNKCKCSDSAIQRYLGKVSGQILDRIDMCVELHSIYYEDMNPFSKNISTYKKGPSSIDMRAQVMQARDIQKERFKGTEYRFNSDLKPNDFENFCHLGKSEMNYMESIYRKLNLSIRSYHRILRVSRTIADLAGSKDILKEHLLEATGYRPDMNYWNL